MTSSFLVLKGIADPEHTEGEQVWTESAVHSLKKSGAEVVVIGNSLNGFSMRELLDLKKLPIVPSNIIVYAHGNFVDDQHYMEFSKSHPVYAKDFYKFISELCGVPVNIFMFSCGSGNGLKDGQRHLPHGSTIFNLVLPDRCESFAPLPESFSIEGSKSASPAESLFLNIMSHGLPDELKCNPCITVTRGTANAQDVTELWGLAKSFCCEWLLSEYPPEYTDKAVEFLVPYLDEKLETVMQVMEFFGRAVLLEQSVESLPLTPHISLRLVLDEEDFKSQVVEAGLLGPIGAMAYALKRDDLIAFQRPLPSIKHG